MYYYFVISAFIGGLIPLCIGLFICFRSGSKILNMVYGFLSISSGVWCLGQWGYFSAQEYNTALFSSRLSNLAAPFIPTFYLHFIFLLIGKKFNKTLLGSYLLTLFFALFSFSSLYIFDMRPQMMFKYFTHGGKLFDIFGIFFSLTILYAVYLLIITLRVSFGGKRIQYVYILGASVVGFIGGSTTFPLVYGIQIPPYGLILFGAYPVIIAYAIIKHHLMDIRLAVTKVTIFFIIYLSTFAVPFYIGYKTQSWVLSTLFMAILATLGPIMHRRLQAKAENVLLAKQKRYQKFLLNSARGMIQEHNLERLLNVTIHVIKRSVKPKFVAIFLKAENGSYLLKAWRGHGVSLKDLSLKASHPLVQMLEHKREAVLWDDSKPALIDLPLPARLIVPAHNDKELLGIMLMGEKEDGTPYTEDDCNVFDILSRQAALAIDNCLYMEAARKNQEKLFEAEKLAGIGGMAAGMSHQFKNRLNSFVAIYGDVYLASQYIKDKYPQLLEQDQQLRENIGYLDKSVDDATKEVKRCNALVQGIIDYAKEKTSLEWGHFSFKEALEAGLKLVRIKHQCVDKDLPFEFFAQIPSDDRFHGVKSYVHEILFNLLDNAFEAIEDKIKYHLAPGQAGVYKPMVRVVFSCQQSGIEFLVADNGAGIKDEDKPRIFSPFFTTKSSAISGSGMGMYILKRMVVEQMRGAIHFESCYLEGTTFRVALPASNI